MPYCDVPAAIASWMSFVFSLLLDAVADVRRRDHDLDRGHAAEAVGARHQAHAR